MAQKNPRAPGEHREKGLHQPCRGAVILAAGLGKGVQQFRENITAVRNKVVLDHLGGQLIRHGQLHAEHIAAHIADCADNAVLAALLLHGGAVDAARWFQLRICITACPAPIGVLSVQWCLQESAVGKISKFRKKEKS